MWERKSKAEAIEAGRRLDLIPDDEVWDNLVVELGTADLAGSETPAVVWRWSMWDHLVQDHDPTKKNFGSVISSPHKFDINYCPPLGKPACRNRRFLSEGDASSALPSGFVTFGLKPGKGDAIPIE